MQYTNEVVTNMRHVLLVLTLSGLLAVSAITYKIFRTFEFGGFFLQ